MPNNHKNQHTIVEEDKVVSNSMKKKPDIGDLSYFKSRKDDIGMKKSVQRTRTNLLDHKKNMTKPLSIPCSLSFPNPFSTRN